MKKAIIILTIFILCSCSIKNDNSLTIDSNGKVDYSIIIAFDKELLSGLNNMDVIDGSVEEYVTSNIKDSYLSSFKKEEYKEEENDLNFNEKDNNENNIQEDIFSQEEQKQEERNENKFNDFFQFCK